MKRYCLVFALALILLMNVFLVSASLTVGNLSHFIGSSYGPGADIQGWINISLTDESASNTFTDTVANSISVIDLLRSDVLLTEEQDYNCTPVGCGSAYEATNGEASKTFSVPAGTSKIIGFKLTGSGAGLLDNINSIGFNISSDVAESCTSQLSIDFFADGQVDTGNLNKGGGSCGSTRDYGCFDPGVTTEFYPMVAQPNSYCQRVNLSSSPGFKLGAWMDVAASAEETMIGIYDLEMIEELASCSLGEDAGVGERSCNVSFLVSEPQEYYLCVYNDKSTDYNSKLHGYTIQNGCGFFTASGFPQPEDTAFEIFAEGHKFGQVGNLGITEEFPFDQGLSTMFLDYIYTTYENECLTGCVVPVQFNSEVNQDITVSNVDIRYNAPGPKIEGNVYDIGLTDATLSTSGFQQVSLNSGNFTLSNEFAGFDYTLKLGTENLLTERIFISAVPTIEALNPLKAFTRFESKFRAIIELVNDSAIESYSWQFGGDTPKVTDVPSVTHTFLTTGIVPLTLSATDDQGRIGSKIFNIEVGSFEVLLIQELNDAITDLSNISTALGTFPQFQQDGIAEVIDIDGLKRQITDLDSRYDLALTDNDYAGIADDFLGLEIPQSIKETTKTDLVSFYPSRDSVNIDSIADKFGDQINASGTTTLMDGVISWNVDKLDSRVKYTQLGAKFDDRTDPILSVFEFKIKRTVSSKTPASFFVRELDNLKLDGSYGENVREGYVEIPLKGNEMTIIFSTTEDLDIITLPAFVSPSLGDLEIIGGFEEVNEPGIKWALYLLIIFFLLIAGVTVYLFLQHWYKTKYEKYLFKDRNFLFNLIHFIDAQKKKGVKDKEIFSKLRKTGWNSEQVNYVMKKYGGKRTGMLEIPVKKLLGIFQRKQKEKEMAAGAMGVPGARPIPRGVVPGVRPVPGRFSKRFYPK